MERGHEADREKSSENGFVSPQHHVGTAVSKGARNRSLSRRQHVDDERSESATIKGEAQHAAEGHDANEPRAKRKERRHREGSERNEMDGRHRALANNQYISIGYSSNPG